MTRALVLVLAMAACAQGAEIDPQLVGPFVLHAGEPERQLFSPVDALKVSTMAAVERWSAAAGLDAEVGAGGVRVETADRVFTPDTGEEVCAHSYLAEGRIGVATRPKVRCPSLAVLVAHEMGHTLARRGGHAEGGLMRDGRDWTPSDYPITAASLALVCEAAQCSVFAPEAP